jgi:hypothetical protein
MARRRAPVPLGQARSSWHSSPGCRRTEYAGDQPRVDRRYESDPCWVDMLLGFQSRFWNATGAIGRKPDLPQERHAGRAPRPKTGRRSPPWVSTDRASSELGGSVARASTIPKRTAAVKRERGSGLERWAGSSLDPKQLARWPQRPASCSTAPIAKRGSANLMEVVDIQKL